MDSLKINGLDNVILALGGLKYLLQYSKEINTTYECPDVVKRQIELLNGVTLIEKCVDSQNKEVAELANEIVQTFFSKDESNKLNN